MFSSSISCFPEFQIQKIGMWKLCSRSGAGARSRGGAKWRVGGLIGSLLAAVLLAAPTLAAPATDAPPAARPATTPVRLAVLAADGSDATRSLADLLTVHLAQTPGIETIERAEIERVLAEQKLTVEGLVETSARVRLGAVLRAKGLLFLNRKNGDDAVFHVRLVETTHGFVAGFCLHRGGSDLSGTVAAVHRFIANLDLPAEQRTGVTILTITDALPANLRQNPVVVEVMAGIEERLLVELSALPGVLIMERRKLGDVAREGALAGAASPLMAAALLVDGSLGAGSELSGDWGDPNVALTLRVRHVSTGATEVIREEGGLLNLRTLRDRAIDTLCMATMKLRREADEGTLKAEVGVLDALATGYPWASEAAFALAPSDQKRSLAYVKTLLGGLAALPDDYQRALTVARVEQLCREHKIALFKATNWAQHRDLLNFLSSYASFKNPEIVRLLRPFRSRLLEEFEKYDYSNNGSFFDKYTEWMNGIFKLPSTRRQHLVERISAMEADPKLPASCRYFLSSYLLHVYKWKRSDLERFTRGEDPVRRYYAHHLLLQQSRTQSVRMAHLDGMLTDVGVIIGGAKDIWYWRFLHFGPKIAHHGEEYRPNQWVSDSLLDLCTYRPELKPRIQQRVFAHLRELTVEADFLTIDEFNYRALLDTISETELYHWLKDAQARENQRVNHKNARVLEVARDWRRRILARHPEFEQAESPLTEEIILSSATYGKRLEELARPPEPVDRRSQIGLQQFLVDGNTLWIGVSGTPVRYTVGEGRWHHPVGLLQIDLEKREVVSERMRWFAEGGERLAYTIPHGLHGPVKVGDHLVVLQPGIGMIAIPIKLPGMAAWRRAGFDEGLPVVEDQVWRGYRGSLSPLRNGVCLRLDTWVVYWDLGSWNLNVLYDLHAPTETIGYGERLPGLDGIATNPETGHIWMSLSLQNPREAVSFRRTVDTPWIQVDRSDLPSLPPRDEQAAASRLLRESKIEDVFALAVWNGKIIALRGLVDGWNVSFFTEKGKGADDDNQ